MIESAEGILLVASVILIFSVFAGKAGYRFGLPALLLFLGVGMLFGSDGLGIQFDNPKLTQFIGVLALSIILFSGGMDTKVAEIKPIASQGIVLATIGVLLPLSNSKVGRRFSFSKTPLLRRMEKTEAESVDDMTAANNNDSGKVKVTYFDAIIEMT